MRISSGSPLKMAWTSGGCENKRLRVRTFADIEVCVRTQTAGRFVPSLFKNYQGAAKINKARATSTRRLVGEIVT